MKNIHQRYILFEIISNNNISFQKNQVIKEIWKSLIKFFGEYTAYKVGLWLIRWDDFHNLGIIRCDNINKYQVIATLGIIKSIGNIPIIFHTRKTSGTIKTTLKLWRSIFHEEPPKRKK